MEDPTTEQDLAKQLIKANIAQIRQRKDLIAKIMTRHKQLKDGESLAISKAKAHDDNKDGKTVLTLQETAYELMSNIDGAKKHFKSFTWKPQLLTTYEGMLRTFTSEAANVEAMEALAAKKNHRKTTAGPSNTPPITAVNKTSNKTTKGKAPIMFGGNYSVEEDYGTEEDYIERSNAD